MPSKAGVRAFHGLPRVVDFPVFLQSISAETTDIFSNVEVVRHWRECWGEASKPLENRTSVYFPWYHNPHKCTERCVGEPPYPDEFKAGLFPSSARFSSPTKVVLVMEVDGCFGHSVPGYLSGWAFDELVVVFMAHHPRPDPSHFNFRSFTLSCLLDPLYSLQRWWYRHLNQLPKSARPVKVTFVNSDLFYAEDFRPMRSTLQDAYSHLVSAVSWRNELIPRTLVRTQHHSSTRSTKC
jgi:hypothetical protein